MFCTRRFADELTHVETNYDVSSVCGQQLDNEVPRTAGERSVNSKSATPELFARPGQLLKTACGSPCYAAPEMIAGKRLGLRVLTARN